MPSPLTRDRDVPTEVAKLLRKIVTAIILVPLAMVIIAFAVANRQIVTVSFDPFSVTEPAAVVALPLFALIIRVAHHRRADRRGRGLAAAEPMALAARRLEREVADLRGKASMRCEVRRASRPCVQSAGSPPQRRCELRPPVP